MSASPKRASAQVLETASEPQEGKAGEAKSESQDETIQQGSESVTAEQDKQDAEQPEEAKSQGAEQGGDSKGENRKRRLWKKKDMPGGLWLKCESCAETIFRKELEEKRMVCPSCGFHFTMPGPARLQFVLDEGTWDERFAELTAMDRLNFTDKVTYAEKIEKTVKRLGQKEALLCGFGKILGRKVVMAVLDFKFMGGSMGEVVGEKISLAAELATANRLPLIIFTSSGGARMHEGMLSLMQMAKTCAALHRLNERGGYSICIMTNPTTGGVTASFASVCDVTLAEPGALIGFAGPRVIATTLKQELPPGFQRAEFLISRGQIDAIVHRDEMREKLGCLIDFGQKAWSGETVGEG